MDDLISKKAVLALPRNKVRNLSTYEVVEETINVADIEQLLPAQLWILCSERLPEEDHWLNGSGKQFSNEVLVSIWNSDDEDAWIDISYTIDGEWELEVPRNCQIVAWREQPEPHRKEGEQDG